MDCAGPPNYLNLACHGGTLPDALRYVTENRVVREEDYPYKADQGRCQDSNGKWGFNATW